MKCICGDDVLLQKLLAAVTTACNKVDQAKGSFPSGGQARTRHLWSQLCWINLDNKPNLDRSCFSNKRDDINADDLFSFYGHCGGEFGCYYKYHGEHFYGAGQVLHYSQSQLFLSELNTRVDLGEYCNKQQLFGDDDVQHHIWCVVNRGAFQRRRCVYGFIAAAMAAMGVIFAEL
ncbi:hypothetical protein LTR66_014504 [Elasticomyces elasticus]|nr:hypothetical protein LTR66_014504 [Elasticomyces elasticus]